MIRALRATALVAVATAIAAAATLPASAHGTHAAPNQSRRSPSVRLLPRSDVGAGRRILIYGPSLAERKDVNEATIARRLGFDVTVATAEEWAAMSEPDFRRFRAIVFGDPSCKTSPRRLATANENRDVWSAAVSGNMVVSGFDPVWHAAHGTAPGPQELIANTILYVARGGHTGLAVSLSCYYVSEPPGTPVKMLRPFGTFTVNGQGEKPLPGCPNRIRVIDGTHRLVRGITDAELSHWGCSVHEAIDASPGAFEPVAIEERSGAAVLIAGRV